MDDAETAAAEAEHRVELVQRLDALAHALEGNAERGRHSRCRLVVRQELCNGGSSVRIVTAPFMRERPRSRALEGRSLASAARRSSPCRRDRLAHGADLPSPKNMCSVRQSHALGPEGDRVDAWSAGPRWRARRGAAPGRPTS